MSFAPGINGVAIYEENTPQTFTIDGSDVGTDSPDRSAITRQSGKGTLKKLSENFSWTIQHDNETTHNSLESADHGAVQWKLVVWTFNGALFALDTASFAPEPTPQMDPESEEYPYQLRYDLVSANITQGTNLISAYRRSQGQSVPSNGTTNVVIDIPFPFPGATVTLSNGATAITVEALDDTDASLATTTTSTGSGRVSAELTLPANTQTVRIDIDDYQDAALRVDGGTTLP